uniref:Neprosin PEP catalytic domain-containing protein n=1 Tax=Oryza meridionalis TaxID=40149 RepID=A0A0E0C1X8_9ORYZ
MFRLVQVLQAISICAFLLVDARAVRLYPSLQEENNSLGQYLLHAAPNQKMMLYKTFMMSNSILTRKVVHDINSAKVSYFATHQSTGPNENYYGLRATMDVYGHELKPGQLSGGALWVSHFGDDGKLSSYNAVGAGWHIDPERYGDSRPHFYTSWTVLNEQTVLRLHQVLASIDPVSDDKSLQSITVEVLLDMTSGDWWVYYGFNSVPTGVGSYPKSLFTNMAEKANAIAFGGYVVTRRALPTPPMGSGSHPHTNKSRAASLTNLGVINQDGNTNPINADLPTYMGNEQCYSITPVAQAECFYGGPGGCMP